MSRNIFYRHLWGFDNFFEGGTVPLIFFAAMRIPDRNALYVCLSASDLHATFLWPFVQRRDSTLCVPRLAMWQYLWPDVGDVTVPCAAPRLAMLRYLVRSEVGDVAGESGLASHRYGDVLQWLQKPRPVVRPSHHRPLTEHCNTHDTSR